METDNNNFTYSHSPILSIIFPGIFCCVGLVENISVIITVVFVLKARTVTNWFILNLAVIDFGFLIGIPFHLVTVLKGSWIFGNVFCKLYRGITDMMIMGTSLFPMILSIFRYIAVCHPLKSKKWITLYKSKIVGFLTWTVVLILTLPIFLNSKTEDLQNEKILCNIILQDYSFATGSQIYVSYSFVTAFILPMLVIIVLSILMIKRLKSVDSQWGGNNLNNESGEWGRRTDSRKVTRLVLAINTAYFACWGPYYAVQFALTFWPWDYSPFMKNVIVLTRYLSYVHSLINPVLYTYLSDNFRSKLSECCFFSFMKN